MGGGVQVCEDVQLPSVLSFPPVCLDTVSSAQKKNANAASRNHPVLSTEYLSKSSALFFFPKFSTLVMSDV